MNIEKSQWHAGGSRVSLTMPLTKVDQEKRLVHGFASLDNEDSQDDVVLASASSKAFSRFRGNIREMHQPVAVGKMVDFKEESFYDPKANKTYKGIYVTVYVSKGAPQTWEKVLDGTLTGFSIGGNILDASDEFNKDAGKSVRVVKDYELVELSLVDNPANQMANIFSIEKMNDGSSVMKGMVVDTRSEYTFYCKTDEIAKTSIESLLDCPVCGDPMESAGWFEYTDESDRTEKMTQSVRKYLSSINEAQGEPAINEGGVDVAEDTVQKDARPGDAEIPVGGAGEPVTEEESSVGSEVTDVTDEDGDAKVVGADAEAAENSVSEVDDAEDDLAKMIGDLTTKINESLVKNREALDTALAEVNGKVEKVVAELDQKGSELAEKYGELSKKFDSIKDELGKMEKSIESLQDDSAVKKSGDLGGEPEGVLEKSASAKASTSVWGGHFLGVKSLD